ncbi:hypothetical protein HGRIS_002278 [Hohenbuehelia grisea]|uniref:Mitochondrial half-size ABC transporter n=1 Tax=Hohenbuehelia grisea TaxID=104357 RepID=A0ABR3JLW9_9AGAR
MSWDFRRLSSSPQPLLGLPTTETDTMRSPSTPALLLAILVLRILSPAIVFLSTVSLITTRPPTPASPSPITSVVVATRIPRRAVILSFLSICGLTFFFDGAATIVPAVIRKSWERDNGLTFNTIVGLASFLGLAALGAWKDVNGVDVWSLKRVKYSLGASLLLDIPLVVLLGLIIKSSATSLPLEDTLHFSLAAFRVLVLIPLLHALVYPRVVYASISADSEEEPIPTASSFLLPTSEPGANASTGLSPVPGLAAGEASKYGTFRTPRSTLHRSTPNTRAATPAPSSNGQDTKGEEKPEIALDPSWSEIWQRIKRISPYLWPKNSRPLQGLAAICIVILLIGRVVMVLLPWTLGQLVGVFESGGDRSPWPYLWAYVGLRFLQGSGGLAALRDAIWAPVMQYSDREMSILSFNHLLSLSFAFHTRRKTGEILRILDRGAAINHTLELILFNVIPTFIDILIALFVFCYFFEWTLGLVIFIVMLTYVTASVVLTGWRTKIRRQMNERDVITRGIHTDCLLNYETIKYFNGEDHEASRYSDALRDYQVLEYKVIISLNLLNLVQNFIITLGLLIGSMIVVLRVTNGQAKPSEFVMFITYLAQLYGPLNSLGYIYRSINQSLVDTEKLLKLLAEPSDVTDKPNAPDLIVTDGEIEFQDVHFSYDGRGTALRGISFKVPKGSSVALVGESGAGKSTILRLLYRFYDLGEGEGRILIDGQDIRDVTQSSLRKAIGVVPQDSVLFNASIAYNIGYGKFGASPDEVEAAAMSAQMHDRIMSFPDGYETKVGERGIRLSGGEKQRIAIARTLLKNPPILLLDEATSALDTSTEKDIQKALQNLVQGRSSLSIAHRLSTIASADLILVLQNGQVVEQGTHKELVAQDGVFASMWADQVSASEEPAASVRSSVKKEASGLSLNAEPTFGPEPPAPQDEEPIPFDVEPIGQVVATPDHVAEDIPHDADATNTQTVPVPEASSSDAPAEVTPGVAFPSSEAPVDAAQAALPTVDQPSSDAPSAPIAFPTSAPDDTASQDHAETVTAAQSPGVTFGESVNATPRSGTPGADSEPKRPGQFQRLARRISLTTRRQGSSSSMSMIPGLKRDTSARQSEDGSSRGEPSARTSNDSPAASLAGEDKPKKKKDKKGKKEKRKSVV